MLERYGRFADFLGDAGADETAFKALRMSETSGEAVAEASVARLRTGRPLAADEWIMRQEAAIKRKLCPAKRGPKPKLGGRGES